MGNEERNISKINLDQISDELLEAVRIGKDNPDLSREDVLDEVKGYLRDIGSDSIKNIITFYRNSLEAGRSLDLAAENLAPTRGYTAINGVNKATSRDIHRRSAERRSVEDLVIMRENKKRK